MSAAATSRDPFGLTADIEGYVPREATEQALASLVATLRDGRRPAALIGPPGLGKTLLLHLVARRLDDRLRAIYLPYAALPLDELCAWALSLLGFSQSDDTIGDLIQTASQLFSRGSGLLLLIDDASAMPLPTARKLGDLVAASRGALRLLVAAAEGPSASRMLAATGANVHVVRLLEPMSEEETRHYVAARLARADIEPSLAARFDASALQSIHRLSAGIPRRVHSVASEVLRGRAPEAGAHDFEETHSAATEPAAAPPGEAHSVAADTAAQTDATPVTVQEAETTAVQQAATTAARETDAREDATTHAAASADVSQAAEEPAVAPAAAAVATDRPAALPVTAPVSAASEAREAEVAPAFEALREVLAPRPLARIEAAPRARSVFATALAFGALLVAVPWLRAELAPPLPGVAAPSAADTTNRSPERKPSAAEIANRALARKPRETVAGGSVPAEIAPGAATLSVQINARPWANIEVNGVDLGPTPIAGIPLLAGRHRFRAHMPDGRVLEREVEISAENRFVVFE